MSLRTGRPATMTRLRTDTDRLTRAILADSPAVFARLDDGSPYVNETRPPANNIGSPVVSAYSGSLVQGGADVVPGRRRCVNLTGGYVDLGDPKYHPNGLAGTLTAEVVCRPVAVNLGAQMVLTMDKEWQLRIESDGSILFDVNQNGSTAVADVQTPAGTMVAGVRHHVMATYDRAAPYTAIYVDGALTTSSGAAANQVFAQSGNMQAGRRSDGLGAVFGGALGWVAIYGQALPAHRAREHGQAAMSGGS